MKTNFAQGADALADEIDSEEGVVTESAEAVREAAERLDVQTIRINCLKEQRDELLAALKEIAECAEGHPLYMPGATPKDVEREGGDAAFVTEDVAWRARRAISAIEQPVEDQTMTGYGHDIGCVPECGAA